MFEPTMLSQENEDLSCSFRRICSSHTASAHRRSTRYFVVEHGPLHQVVHLGYDNLADLEMRRAKRDADPEGQSINERLRGSWLAKKTNYADQIGHK